MDGLSCMVRAAYLSPARCVARSFGEIGCLFVAALGNVRQSAVSNAALLSSGLFVGFTSLRRAGSGLARIMILDMAGSFVCAMGSGVLI